MWAPTLKAVAWRWEKFFSEWILDCFAKPVPFCRCGWWRAAWRWWPDSCCCFTWRWCHRKAWATTVRCGFFFFLWTHELDESSVKKLLLLPHFLREDRGFLGDLWEQRDPRPDRGNAEMCRIKSLSVCYWDTGNAHTLLSEHNASQGAVLCQTCKSVCVCLYYHIIKILCVCAVQGAGWAGQDIQDVDAASVFIDLNIQSLGLSGQTAPRNTLRRQRWLFRLGPHHETAWQRGI